MPKLFETLTAQECDALQPTLTSFFFPVGPLEDHGPHLPMGLDLLEARALCEALAAEYEHQFSGHTGVVMPVAPLGIESNTSRLAIRVRGHVLRDWLVDACLSLVQAGFFQFVCVSGHAGPRQLTAIEEASKVLRARFRFRPRRGRGRPFLVSASSCEVTRSKAFESLIWPDPRQHGAFRDTSYGLFLSPDLVKPLSAELPVLLPEPGRLQRYLKWLRHQREGYWGEPGPMEARADWAAKDFEERVKELFPKLRAIWEGADPAVVARSWYSVVPVNKSFFRGWLLFSLLLILMGVWVYWSTQFLLQE